MLILENIALWTLSYSQKKAPIWGLQSHQSCLCRILKHEVQCIRTIGVDGEPRLQLINTCAASATGRFAGGIGGRHSTYIVGTRRDADGIGAI